MGGHLSHLERVSNPEPYLAASCGPIRGNIYTHGDKIVDGFLAIPYAKPPIGELKFKKPEEADKWTEVLDCTKYGPICPASENFVINKDKGDEEKCLTLNVFKPNWKSEKFEEEGRPIMVFIHGGAFAFGSSSDFDDYSLSGTLPLKDVIVVSINYRVGILGFLTTNSEDCQGNFGLWDQTLALKWVQKHIKSFGGNPKNVTVFGQSAGGASADYLSLSPHSRDLFQKVIGMSGSAFCDFIRTKEGNIEVYKELAQHHGYSDSIDDSEKLIEWYKTADISKIGNLDNFEPTVSGFLKCTPNFDGDFFPKPLEILREEAQKKSIMFGLCEQEGLLIASTQQNMKKSEEELEKMLKKIYKSDSFENSEEVRQGIYEKYTKDHDLNDKIESKKPLIEFFSDQFFNLGVFDAARSATKNGNDVYFYCLEYCNLDSFGSYESLLPFKAATHCTDLRYVLGEGIYHKFEPNEDDLKMMDQMTTFFTNFAKFGNPNNKEIDEWKKSDSLNFLKNYRISLPKSEMRDQFQNGRILFLKELNSKNKIYKNIFLGTK